MEIKIPLSDFELEILNKLLHTEVFADYSIFEKHLLTLVSEQKELVMKNGITNDADFQSFQAKIVFDISQFLYNNDFLTNRDGRTLFLTERGKQLKQEGSYQEYVEWKMARDAQLIADMHTIETRGYLDKDQTFTPEATPVDKKYKNRILLYVLLLAAIFLLWAYFRLSAQ